MTSPISSSELLAVADDLLGLYDPASPRPELLRRAVSSAYYALFHELIAEAVRQTLGVDASRSADRHAVARFYQHGEMRSVCRWVLDRAQRRTLPDRVSALLDSPQAALVEVAAALVTLQDARHDADYNHLATVRLDEARSHVTLARTVLAGLPGLGGDRVYSNFLALLLGGPKIALR